ncbi:methyl-accepting chemotaxis protein [Stieleria sp. JC731]|uniref:methyl-accepting chemotaxis protein n=1 Tax=Pirellulaceae TaxID=2691357 RepID=UPI001E5B8732|nr:methyl-accepting chemotaxis protein [Stieleria sp. JC731]MCC9603422.1 methyl-accepting chemotaxis protein [Stieleria sp. JC731]
MNLFRQLTQSMIGKLVALTAVFAIGFLVFGTLAVSTLNIAKVHGPHYERVVLNKDLLADVLPPPNYIVETYLTAHLLAGEKDPAEVKQLVDRYAGLKQEYADRQEHWRNSLPEGKLKTEINETSRVPAEAFFAVMDSELIPAIQAGEYHLAKDILTQQLAPLFADHRKSVDVIVATTNQNAADTEDEVRELISNRLSMMWIVGLVVAASVAAFAFWLSVSVRRQEREKAIADQKRAEMEAQIKAQMEEDRLQSEETEAKVETVLKLVNRIAGGNFEVDFPDLGSDGIGQVSEALSVAVSSIRNALSEVREVSTTVATASNEMSRAAEEISRGAQMQASRLEETASSLEEITSTVKQNSDNAQEARALANSSRDIATDGGVVVGDAVTAMHEINESSKQISDIITTIDEIAFQTNLLALNAAVEAARAGEQGRGFAVVASEVRNLAQRTASSAKEIKSLIQNSASKVERGTELVNKSGETLGEIVDSVKRVTDIVAEIAAASQEQLSAIKQVTAAVTQIDQLTQGNANQTEELAGTSGSVFNHSRQLDIMVSRFQLGNAGDVESDHHDVAPKPKNAGKPVVVAPVAPVASFPVLTQAADAFMDF